ncbi:MAG: amidohydrolase family protein [Pseudomonadota bacterium]
MIIDAHHHIWRQADLPWLQGPTVPRIFGAYDSIKRDYLIDEYMADCTAHGITKSVYVQANWPVDGFADEVAWVQDVNRQCGWPHAIVGYCDMLQADARPDLDRLRAFPAMRGIRQQLHWHDNPLYRFAPDPDLTRNTHLQRNVGYLSDYGWVFELQVFACQVDGACELVDRCPGVTFVLQHAGMLEDVSAAGRTTWRAAMVELAKRDNVVTKLSGLGTFVRRNDPEHIRELVQATVEIFGAERCMFGSNFPIEKIWTTYDDLVAAYQAATADFRLDAKRAIFSETAARIYKL